MANIGHNRGTMWLTRAYNDVNRDPECERAQTMVHKDRLKTNDLAVLAGLNNQTVKRLVNGETRNPQHRTFAKLYAAMGYEYGLSRKEKPDYIELLPEAREQRRVYREYMKQQKAKDNGRKR